LYGDEFAQSWASLLVGREYKVPSGNQLLGLSLKGDIPKSVLYAVGQPMGALSSWAMLAITHHFIVHYCAWITSTVRRGQAFLDYAVLGDDIVIWNKAVADKYLEILDQLGVSVGLAKSIISEKGTGLEFAKRTIVEGVDVSPISFLEQSSAHRSLAMLREFALKYKLTFLQVLRFLGYGYQVGPDKQNRIVNSIKLALTIPKSYQELKSLFTSHLVFDFRGKHWTDVMSYPNALKRRILVRLVHKELQLILKESKDMFDRVMHLDCSLKVDSIGPWATPAAKVRFAATEKYTQKYIKQLEVLINTSKLYLELNAY